MSLIISAIDDDDLGKFDEETGMFRGRFLDDFVDEASAVNRFGSEYRRALISVPDMQAFISPRFIAPARPLDISFPPFTIDAEYLPDYCGCNEVLEDVGILTERFEWYCEVDEGVTEEWLCTHIDENIVLRHIPILPSHTGCLYYHAHHLDAFLHFAFRLKDGHQVFGKDDRLSKSPLWCEYRF